MNKTRIRQGAIGVVVVAIAAGIAYLAVERARSGIPADTLYGNVETREVNLAFNAEGRVDKELKREGDTVKAGDLLATLDPSTYASAVKLAEAKRDAAKAALDLLEAGTRPEQIAEAKAAVAGAKATLANAEATFKRQEKLTSTDVASHQAYDDALRARDAAIAALDQAQAARDQAVNGPRPQEIAQAKAQYQAAESMVALSKTQLANTKLSAPANGIIMTRVVEPGTVVLPGASIYSMAIAGEVWVRAFAPEPMLSRVAPGTEVKVTADGGGTWKGRIGYVSPVAEFTPKTVETPELRTQLVYRLRVRIENPDQRLRQGMPVTITLPEADKG